MPFPIPSLDEARDFLVALGKALFPASNYGSRRSWHGRKATYAAGATTQILANVAAAQRDVHPLTAGDGKPINDWGKTVGVARKGATPARRSSAGRVRGAAFATASLGEQLKHASSGLLFELNQNVSLPDEDDPFVDADIVAVDVGSQTRLLAGEVLSFVNEISGIERNVVLQLPLDQDGFDAEQFGSYRARVLSTFSQSTSGGNQSDFVKWALASLPSVATAFCYPNRAGRGTVDVVAFYNASGTARSLTDDDRAAVALYIRTQTTAPFQITGSGGGLRILETVADPRPVEILLTPDGRAAFAKDWDDSSPGVVLSWNATTRELRFTGGSLPLSLRAGHRLVFRGVASAQDGTEFKIESISGVDKVILEVAPAVSPVATDVIYSGGPLVSPVRDAIVAHLNGETVYAARGLLPLAASAVQSIVGLDILAEGLGSANPGGIYNSTAGPSWSGGIVRAALFGIAKFKGGVRDVTIVTPASNYEAVDDAFPNDFQIHYVTPGSVLVRMP